MEKEGDRDIIATALMMNDTGMVQDLPDLVHLLLETEWEAHQSLKTNKQFLVALGTEAVPAYIKAFSDACGGMCFYLRRILAAVGPPAEPLLIKALQSPNWRIRGNGAETLGKMRAEAALPALWSLFTDPELFVRHDAAEAVGLMARTPAGATLIATGLTHPDARIQKSAIHAIGESGDNLWCWHLATLLTSPDCTIRYAVACALGRLGPSAAPLLERALTDSYDLVRHAAAEGLGEYALRSSIPALETALADPDPDVRRASAWALYLVGRPATAAQIRALAHPDPEVRSVAAESLAKQKEEIAVYPLLRMAEDYPESKSSALAAFRRIGAPAAGYICAYLGEGIISPSLAEKALIKIKHWSVKILCAAIEEPNETVQLTAISALIKIDENKRKPACICDQIGPVRAMRRVGPPQPGLGAQIFPAVPTLIILLRHPDPALRERAAEALGAFEIDYATIPLAALIAKEQNEDVRAAAVNAIGRLGTADAVPHLIASLNDPSDRVRRIAVLHLGDRCEPAATGLLQERFTHETNPFTRRDILEALMMCPKGTATDTFIEGLADEESLVRDTALDGLARDPDVCETTERTAALTAMLCCPDADHRKKAAGILADCRWLPATAEELAWAAFARQDWDRLGGMGAAATAPVTAGLGDKEASIRRESVTAAAAACGRKMKAEISAALDDEDKNVRLAAGRIVAGWEEGPAIFSARAEQAPEETAAICSAAGDARYHSLLLTIAGDYTHPRAQGEAIIGLARMHAPETESLIRGCLNGKDEREKDAQAGCIEALSLWPDDDRQTDLLIRALHSPHPTVRRQAAKCLGTCNDTRVLPPLRDALRDADGTVRTTAAEALTARGWHPETDDEAAALCFARRNWKTLAGMDAATEILIHALIHDADHHIRREAQKLLENRQGPKVLDALIRSLDDEDNLIRWHAPTALSRQGTAAIPALVMALSHPENFIRRDAVTALGEIGDETVAPACRTLLKDDDRKVRIEAMKTVEKLGGRTPTQTD